MIHDMADFPTFECMHCDNKFVTRDFVASFAGDIDLVTSALEGIAKFGGWKKVGKRWSCPNHENAFEIVR